MIIFNYFINYYVVSPIIKVTGGIGRFLKNKEPFDVKVETKDELFHLVNSIKELLAQSKREEAVR